MICPNCGSNIPDGLTRCPACRIELDRTVVVPRVTGTWCESCGSLVPEGADVCPVCGMPVPHRKHMRGEDRPKVDPGVTVGDLPSDHDETNQMPRIESAIPAEDDDSSPVAEHDRMPRTRVLVITMIVAVLVMSAAMLFITHPWNPGAYDTSAKQEADTSMAGFPGTIHELAGQDKGGSGSGDGSPSDVKSGDEATLEKLSGYYEKLGKLEKRADKNEELFRNVAYSGTSEERRDGQKEAKSLSLEISNLLSDIDDVDVTSGTYADDAEHLKTLGNYLRNRMDALTQAWGVDVLSDDPSVDRDQIEAPLTDSDGSSVTDGYKTLFEENYGSWKPRASK